MNTERPENPVAFTSGNNPRKLTSTEISYFFSAYYDRQNNKFKGQRLGQAFMNDFDIRPDSELFYMTIDSIAKSIIWEHYWDGK